MRTTILVFATMLIVLSPFVGLAIAFGLRPHHEQLCSPLVVACGHEAHRDTCLFDLEDECFQATVTAPDNQDRTEPRRQCAWVLGR